MYIYLIYQIYVYIYICIYLNYMYIYILFQILFPYRLLQNMKYSSLCYTVSLDECILLICLFGFGHTGSSLLQGAMLSLGWMGFSL